MLDYDLLDEHETPEKCPFCAILDGEKSEDEIIIRDDVKRMAIIADAHPEGAIHWLVVPFEHIEGIEALQEENENRFVELVNFAIKQTKVQADNNPELAQGFTVKFHCGPYETLPHAKLHILSTE